MTNSKEMQQITATAMQQTQQVAQTPKVEQVRELLYRNDVVKQLEAIIGKEHRPAFQQTVMNVLLMPQNKALRECKPVTIMRAAMACAVTGLTIDPAFGQAAIVPFKDTATFMPMKNGLVKLARQSGLIKDVRAIRIYDGDIEHYNPITGEISMTSERSMFRLKGEPKDLICIGYYGYVEFKDGQIHTLYKSIEELQEHGSRYSKTYGRYDSLWRTNAHAMYEKTIIRQLLLKSGAIDQYKDTRLGFAMKFDTAVPDSDNIMSAQPQYVDAGEAEDVTNLTEAGNEKQ